MRILLTALLAVGAARSAGAQCLVPDVSWVGDGYCDGGKTWNNLACSWDGGDCCASTCVTGLYQCGHYTYFCDDPAGNNNVCNAQSSWLGDGYCDSTFGQYNTQACSWDGGDCCASSCVSTLYSCGGDTGFTCGDPLGDNSACVVPDAALLGNRACDVVGHYNSLACNWDGGDCCQDSAICTTGTGCIDQHCEDPLSAFYGVNSCTESYLGDGYCDVEPENTAACGWDGGDCCEDKCSCGSNCYSNCGEYGYNCLDPSATKYLSIECSPERASYLGDSYCDIAGGYNTEACGWDGGDCCISTCRVVAEDYPKVGDVSVVHCDWVLTELPYDCQDPLYSSCDVAELTYIGDGYCDGGRGYNNPQCNWDGGDCCATSCGKEDFYQCGNYEYFCEDPANTNDVCNVDDDWLGDGYCDSAFGQYNTPECAYDGGDCCASSCVSSIDYTCGSDSNLECSDPLANNDVCVPAFLSYLGNGICNKIGQYNSLACGWDGGDCCADSAICTSVTCDAQECRDPTSAFFGTQSCTASWHGDGYCDTAPDNTAACGWDGGDCCESTCFCAWPSTCYSDCGAMRYDCQDPTVVLGGCDVAHESHLGDGYCDTGGEYNTASCGWDGGDCCPSTCRTTVEDYPNVGEVSIVVCDWVLTGMAYECLDPLYALCDALELTYIGDGYCDGGRAYNNPQCNWDGGDCCSSSCDKSEWYECGNYEYFCSDPAANNDVCNVKDSWLGDGYCDSAYGQYNTAACAFDSGDCCASSCVSTTTFMCGSDSNLACEDPLAENNACVVAVVIKLGNAICDTVGQYNSLACGWDGGDCCADSAICTSRTCETQACKDPSSIYFGVKSCTVSWHGDGYCDDAPDNSDSCGWDGGDCCAETCSCEGLTCYAACGEYAYDCEDPDVRTSLGGCEVTQKSYLGDGYCDSEGGYNTDACSWDGGDCCPYSCTCEAGLPGCASDCGVPAWDCQDPGANTVSSDNSDYAVIASGLNNIITGNAEYAFVGGGKGNYAYQAEWSTISGGNRNLIVSKYGAILGGFANRVQGKMAAVLGGSKNTAQAKHAVALGYQSWTYASESMVGGFSGDTPGSEETTDEAVTCSLDSTQARTIKFCADKVLVNDEDFLLGVQRARQLVEASNRAAAISKRMAAVGRKLEKRRLTFFEQMAAQTAVLEAQAKQLRC